MVDDGTDVHAQLAEAKQELANILWPMTPALWRTTSAGLRDQEPGAGRGAGPGDPKQSANSRRTVAQGRPVRRVQRRFAHTVFTWNLLPFLGPDWAERRARQFVERERDGGGRARSG